MNPIFRNIIAIIVGWFAGSAINMGLIQLGHSVFPFPGLDPNNMESLASAMSTMDSKHFLFPFLAHTLGTLIGAFVAGWVAATHKMKFALAVGLIFLIGGVIVNYMLPGPNWFTILDIVIAYIPMAWVGGTLARKISKAA